MRDTLVRNWALFICFIVLCTLSIHVTFKIGDPTFQYETGEIVCSKFIENEQEYLILARIRSSLFEQIDYKVRLKNGGTLYVNEVEIQECVND